MPSQTRGINVYHGKVGSCLLEWHPRRLGLLLQVGERRVGDTIARKCAWNEGLGSYHFCY
uniref:Uncharacterized protein n=1 Tax=Arundo donax TaxID=35708 RepID=A0A0A9EJ64_ARUDO